MKKLMCLLVTALLLVLNITCVSAEALSLSVETVDRTFKYDGQPHKVDVVVNGPGAHKAEVTYSISTDDGETWSEYTSTVPTLTDAGKIKVMAKATTKSGSAIGTYSIEVLKRKISILTGSYATTFNNCPTDGISNSFIEVIGEGFVEGEMASDYPKTNGHLDKPNTEPDAGSQATVLNTIEYSWTGNGKASNYDIIENLGSLVITNNLQSSVIANTNKCVYDGEKHTVNVSTNLEGATIEYYTSTTSEQDLFDSGTGQFKDDKKWIPADHEGMPFPVLKNVGKIYVGVKVTKTGGYQAQTFCELEVVPRDLIIVPSSLTKEYDGTSISAPTYTIQGPEFISGDSATITIKSCTKGNYAQTTLTDIGRCDNVIMGVEWTPAGCNQNYSIPSNRGLLVITPKVVTVKANDKTITLGDSVPSFSATVTGLLESDSIDYSFKTIETPTKAGVYSIIPTGNEFQDKYNINYEVGSLKVNPKESKTQADLDALSQVLANFSVKDEYVGKNLHVEVVTNNTIEETDKTKINEAKEAGSDVLFFNTELHLLVDEGTPTEQDKDIGGDNDVLIPISYKIDIKDKDVINVLRVHDGVVDTLTTAANANGEYFVYNKTNNTITIYAKKYSAYAVTYKEASTSSSSGSSSSTYTVVNTSVK